MRFRYYLHSGVILTGILALFLGGTWLAHRFDVTRDWTGASRHSLSQASRAALEKLEHPVHIVAYVSDTPLVRERVRRLLDRYRRFKPDLDYRFLDPSLVPEQTRQQGVRKDGEMVIEYQSRSQHVTEHSERAVTAALVRLARGQDSFVAFLEGHGERSPFAASNQDFSLWAAHLQLQGLKVQALNIADTGAVPANTGVLVIASPERELLSGEIAAINRYLNDGGNLLWMMDPGASVGLEGLAHELAVIFDDSTIVDPAAVRLGIDTPGVTAVAHYPDHAAVAGFAYASLFPAARPIIDLGSDGDGDWQRSAILQTAADAWGEKDTAAAARYDPGADRAGPLTVGLVLSRDIARGATVRQQRLVLLGDSDFLANSYVGNSGNLDLGLRLVNWLVGADTLIDIPARTREDVRLELTRPQTALIGFGFLLLLPLALLLAGAWAWRRARRG